MLLIQLFFTNTIQRFLLLVQRILAKSSTVFINYIAAGKIGGYVAQTAIAVAQLALKHREIKNLLQRIIVFIASSLDGPRAADKVSKNLKKINVVIGQKKQTRMARQF